MNNEFTKSSRSLTRREFTARSLHTLLAITLVEHLFQGDLLAAPGKDVAVKWLNELDGISLDLKDQKLKQLVWQDKVAELLKQIELDEWLKFIDFAKLERGVKWADNGARSLRFKYPDRPGVPKSPVFGQQIFALKPGRSVVPHGHNNMATAFLVLKGRFHGRHYDRVEDGKTHMIIKPTIDNAFGPGGVSTVSDLKDNVHWFKAQEVPGFIFNIHLLGFDPNNKNRTGRVYVDPNGEKIAGGLIKARLIDSRESHTLYG